MKHERHPTREDTGVEVRSLETSHWNGTAECCSAVPRLPGPRPHSDVLACVSARRSRRSIRGEHEVTTTSRCRSRCPDFEPPRGKTVAARNTLLGSCAVSVRASGTIAASQLSRPDVMLCIAPCSKRRCGYGSLNVGLHSTIFMRLVLSVLER